MIPPQTLRRLFDKIRHEPYDDPWELGLEGPCWVWTGCCGKRADDYPQMKIRGVNYRVNRLVYELFVGPLPIDHDAHHRCENRHCVSPFHIVAIPCDQHSKRGRPENQKKPEKLVELLEPEEVPF